MAPAGFTDDQSAMRRVIWGYIHTLKIKSRIEDNTWNVIFFTVTQDTIKKFGW